MTPNVVVLNVRIKVNKVCACGRVFQELPSGARFLEDDDLFGGWYWECACHSTLFYPYKKELKE